MYRINFDALSRLFLSAFFSFFPHNGDKFFNGQLFRVMEAQS